MPTIELTDKFCRSARAQSGRKTDYFDTLSRGLVLRCTAGGQRTWFVVYGPSARRQWLKLGSFPDISLGGQKGARQRAKDVRAKVLDGGDPVADRKAQVTAQTVSELVENYVVRHALNKRSGKEIARRLRRNVSNIIGTVKLSDLHRRDITKCIDAVKDRDAPIEANRVFADLSAMVRWARGRGDLDQNLTEGMRKPTETVERDRVLIDVEIKTVWQNLPDADMRESTRRIVRLCLLTGQRVGEVSGMERQELNLLDRLWIIPPSRTKNNREHHVPLSDMAIAIIIGQFAAVEDLCRRKRRSVPSFVFPGPGGRATATGGSVSKALKRLEKGGFILGIPPWVPHDLRRTAATHMEAIGINPFIVGHVLNHISVTKASITSRVYARYDYMREKREALELWADRLAAIIAGRGGTVTPLRRAR